MFFLDLPCYPLDSPMFFLCFLMIFPWVPPEKTQGWNFQVRLWLGGHWAAGHHRFPAARSQRDHLPWCLLAVQEPTRNMFGICVAYLWHIYGIFMIYLWYLNEIWKPPGHILEYWSSEWHMVDECRWMDASWRSKPGHLGIMSVKLCHKPAMTGNGTVDTTDIFMVMTGGWFMKLFYQHHNTIYHVTTMDIPFLLNLMPISSYNSNGYTIIPLFIPTFYGKKTGFCQWFTLVFNSSRSRNVWGPFL